MARTALFTSLVAPATTAEMFAEALGAADRAGDAFGLFSAHAYAALAAVFGCDDASAARPHLVALKAAGAGSPYWECWHALIGGLQLVRIGNAAAAAELLRDGWEAAWQIGDPFLECWCAAYLCDALIATGDLDAVAPVISRSLQVQDCSAFGRAEFLRCRGVHAALAAAHPALARTRLDRVTDVIHASGIPFVIAETFLLAGRIAVLEGDAGAAAAAQRGAAETAATFGTPWYLAGAKNLAGRVAALAGDTGAAEAAYQEALAVCARRSFTGAGAEALERIASLATQGASVTEAARLFGAAAALRELSGWVRTADDQRSHDADLSLLQEALGEETVADLWEQGRELDLAGAAAYARRARGERKRPPAGWGSSVRPDDAGIGATPACR